MCIPILKILPTSNRQGAKPVGKRPSRTSALASQHKVSENCIVAILTLKRLPAELRILVFQQDCENNFTSAKASIRSPLYVTLVELAAKPGSEYRILVDQYLKAWKSKPVSSNTFTIDSCASATELQNKTREDRLAIQHLAFNLNEEEKLNPDIKYPSLVTGKKISMNNNLKTICYRSTVEELPAISLVYLKYILCIIVPAALGTLEAIVVEALIEDNFEDSMFGNDEWMDKVEGEMTCMDWLIGAKHTMVRSPTGDRFWVWNAPFDHHLLNDYATRNTKRPLGSVGKDDSQYGKRGLRSRRYGRFTI